MEEVRPYPYASRVAKRFFSLREYAAFLDGGGDEQSFFRLWTQKEAISKIRGQGILSEESAVPEFFVGYRLTLPSKTLILSVCAENDGQELSWQSPSEGFRQIKMEEIFRK